MADGTWMEEVAVGWLAKPRMKQVVDEHASELEWQFADWDEGSVALKIHSQLGTELVAVVKR